MAFLTPRQDPRRLSFDTVPPQSPYTPFSAARSSAAGAAAPTSIPQISSPYSNTHVAFGHQQINRSHTPEPSEEAEAFVSGGLTNRLRATSLYGVTIARQNINKRTPQEVALNFATHFIDETTILYELSESLHSAYSVRPSTRRQISLMRDHLLNELRTWTLIQSAWTTPPKKANDLITQRLQLPTAHLLNLLEVEGIIKVQHIIEWLESNAAHDLKRSGGPQVHPLDDPAYRWRYTAEKFEGEPVAMDFPIRGKQFPNQQNSMIVDDIDDEINQQRQQTQLRLDEIERKAETRLAREVFRLVRAGMPNDAERICREAGQPWRAAALSGGKKASALASNGVAGAARKAWRKAASALATTTREGVPLHERAVAGVLSGVLQPVLAVCSSYDDQLWARLSVLLDRKVDKILDKRLSNVTEEENLDSGIADELILQTFKDCKMTLLHSASTVMNVGGNVGEVTGNMMGVTIDGNEAEVIASLRRVQAYLALGAAIGEEHKVKLMEALAQLSKSSVENGLEWGCRLAVELALFLKYAGILDTPQHESMLLSFDVIVQTYVQFVIDSHRKVDGDDPFERRTISAGVVGYDTEDRANVCAIASNFLAEMENIDVAISTYSILMQSALEADLLQESNEAMRAKVTTENIEDRRVLCLEEAGPCFEPNVLLELTRYTVDRIWEENLDEIREGAGGIVVGTQRRRSSGGLLRMSEGRRLTGGSTATVGSKLDITMTENTKAKLDRGELVIRSIEFLTYSAYPNYEEALLRTTSAARRFFLAQKRETTRRLIEWFPREILDGVRQELFGGYIREFHSWQLYFEAVSLHNNWYVYKTSNEPAAIPDSVRQAAMAQPVQQEAKEKLHMYNAAVREYEKGCQELQALAMTKLYDALLYDNGWMVNVIEDHPSDESNSGIPDIEDQRRIERKRELDMVRKCGIPELVSLLHHIFHRSGAFKDAADMVTLVAREEFKLYEHYRPAEMRALLAKVAESTIKLTDETITVNDMEPSYEGTFFEDFIHPTRESQHVTFAEQ